MEGPGTEKRAKIRASALPLALTVALLALASARALAPHLSVGERVAGLLTFGGAALLAVLTVGLAARGALSVRASIAVAAGSAGVVLFFFIKPLMMPLTMRAIAIDEALLAFSCATGALVGSRIQHPGHLFPACVVAACADVVSVVSPQGPTHALAESERALSLLAISFPVAGTRVFAPSLGIGDVLFLALILAAIAVHGLPYWRSAWLAAAGIMVAGLVSMRFETAIPALPFLAAPVIAFVPGTRALARKDRTVATIAIGVSLVVAGWTLITRFRSG
jgi:hypothetical protein